MKRQLLNLIAVVSFVLCMATLVLWIRSYRVNEGLGRDTAAPPYFSVGFNSHLGILMWYRSNLADHPDGWEDLDGPNIRGAQMYIEDGSDLMPWEGRAARVQRGLQWIGISCGYTAGGDGTFLEQIVAVPYRILVALFGVFPLVLIGKRMWNSWR